MITTKWLQGKNNINEALDIRNKVFNEEMREKEENISDNFDDFAFNVVVYEDDVSAGTGRLLFKDGKYFIDNVCVLKQYRGRRFADLMVRMLVRKAVDMGAKHTYANTPNGCEQLFEAIGFEIVQHKDEMFLMMKSGDVGGHCG